MRKFVKDGQKGFLEMRRSRAQTGFKEPDNVFIMLERLQNEVGAGLGAWPDRTQMLLRVMIGWDDWSRAGMRRGAAADQGGEMRYRDWPEFYQLVTEIPNTIYFSFFYVTGLITNHQFRITTVIFFAGWTEGKEFRITSETRQGWGQWVQASLHRGLYLALKLCTTRSIVPAFFLKLKLQYYFVMMMSESALVHCFQLMCNTCLHILWSQDTRAREGTALQLIHHSLKVWWGCTGSIVLCYVKQWMQSKRKSNPILIFVICLFGCDVHSDIKAEKLI